MNKTVQLGCAFIAAIALVGCTNFRVNMMIGFGPNTPPVPPPPKTTKQWLDVGYWQTFLVAQGSLKPLTFQSNKFDAATVTATKLFQAAPGKVANYSLPQTGCVNLATYHKAVQEGMPKYHPARVIDACAPTPSPIGVKTHDHFYDNTLHYGCSDVSTRHDVADWQRFLRDNGYLMSGTYTSGQFNTTTQTATKAFQGAWGLASTGYVDRNTFNYAVAFASHTSGLGESLMGVDGAAPIEDFTGCH